MKLKLTKEEKQQVRELAARYALSEDVVLRQLFYRGLKSVTVHLHLTSLRNKPLRELDLPKRCVDALECAGFIYVKDIYLDVLNEFMVNLQAIPGVGQSYREMIEVAIRKEFYEENEKPPTYP